MTELLPQTPPLLYVVCEAEQPAGTDAAMALAAVESLNFFITTYSTDPGKIGIDEAMITGLSTDMATTLVDSGVWQRVTFDPDTNFEIEMNPDYQAARLQRIQEAGTADSTEALRDMARIAVLTLMNRAFQIDYNRTNGV